MVRRWSFTASSSAARRQAASKSSVMSRSSASCASPMRPAALRRGISEKLQVRGGDELVGRAARAQQRRDAGARGAVHAADAVGHERAVLAAHGHEVGHRAERGQVGVASPQVRVAEAAAQHLHELQGHAHASQDGALAVLVALRVGHGHVLGHEVDRLVVVGDGQAHAGGHDGGRLRLAGDAAVHRDDEVGVELRARAKAASVRP